MQLATAFRIGAVGPLIAFISFEDILYFPMHGRNPFEISSWDWLPQHTIWLGHPPTTTDLIWIASIGMLIIFIFLVIISIRKTSTSPETFQAFSSPTQKRHFLWLFPITIGSFIGFIILYLNTNIINDQIPFYLLIAFLAIICLLILFSASFPRIRSTFKQLVLIFICYIIFWITATEMDWHAVDAGFHWVVPSSPHKPPGDFWVWADYRMAMWLIYLPITIFLISLMFKFLGHSRKTTLFIGITNFLIFFMGLDSILIFFINGGTFPTHWMWSNLHYSLFDGFFSVYLLIALAIGISCLLIFLYKKFLNLKD
ncbi:MAG: hypothetical protein ACTSRS_17750 [Candidatus Helarchaeota archaeon]